MVIRAKNIGLFPYSNLTHIQRENSKKNDEEADNSITTLDSYPRRIVLELTNTCNLSCIMCGRHFSHFEPTFFQRSWLDCLEPLFYITEEITLMGWGEPTIHPHFSEILEFLSKYPIKKYLCTNGMLLNILAPKIMKGSVDILAVSLDGPNQDLNTKIRKGSNFTKICSGIREIISIRKKKGDNKPYINFVFTAMKCNIQFLPDMIHLAAELGIDEVKVVYLTAFNSVHEEQSLFGLEKLVKNTFEISDKYARDLNITLKLPYIQGEDPAGEMFHRLCHAPWRDLFLGSDGFIRPCMSSPIKIIKFDPIMNFQEIWNNEEYKKIRACINDEKTMPDTCKRCYQSSMANWNKKQSFIQSYERYAPTWGN